MSSNRNQTKKIYVFIPFPIRLISPKPFHIVQIAFFNSRFPDIRLGTALEQIRV